jgi:hypothetical protein
MSGITWRRIALVMGAAIAVLLAYLILAVGSVPRSPRWKGVTVSFGGFTNRSGTPSAALSIQNRTGSALKVMDHYYVEWPEMYGGGVSNNARWSATITNHIVGAGQRVATGTNLVVGAHQSGVVIIPVPSQGNRWFVSLEFARANLQTWLAERLQKKPPPAWVNHLPLWDSVRGFYIVQAAGCEFAVDAK